MILNRHGCSVLVTRMQTTEYNINGYMHWPHLAVKSTSMLLWSSMCTFHYLPCLIIHWDDLFICDIKHLSDSVCMPSTLQ